MIQNILSTKGALQCILGDHDRAISTLNEVLKSEPTHYLCLIRRSQVYKKKRKSRVTISGDSAFEYEAVEEECDRSLNSTSISKDQVREKYVKTFNEIELDDTEGKKAEK
ncbi:unnamed protein product [Sphagnum balticum]